MANEISYSFNLSFSKSGIGSSISKSASLDLAGTEFAHVTHSVTGSAALLNVGGCDQNQVQALINTSTDTDVSLYLDAGATQLHSVLKFGKFQVFTGVPTLYAKTASGTAEIVILTIED